MEKWMQALGPDRIAAQLLSEACVKAALAAIKELEAEKQPQATLERGELLWIVHRAIFNAIATKTGQGACYL